MEVPMQTLAGRRYYEVRHFETIPEMLEQSVSLYGDQTAVCHRLLPENNPEKITYRQLYADVLALATGLETLDMAAGRIAVVGENSYHWILSYLAAVSGTAVIVPLDRLLPEAEILQLLSRGKVDTIFFDSAFLNLFENSASSVPGLKNCICMRSGRLKNEAAARFDSMTGIENEPVFFDLTELLERGRKIIAQSREEQLERLRIRREQIDPDAMMSLLFTSGTTSMSKAVMLSQRNVCSDIIGTAGVVSLKPGIRMLSILPLHHTFENTCGLLMALYVGAGIFICDGLRYIQKNMKEYQTEMIIGVPAVFENFYQKINDTLDKTGKAKLVERMRPVTRILRKIGIDLRRKIFHQILEAFGGAFYLGISGAAPIDPEIIRFFDDIGVRILQGYGLTETSPIVAGCNSRLFVPGTVGQPVDGVMVGIDSETDGEPGEILVKGPIVMLGYYDDEEATRAVKDEQGWFHTGDIGRIDPKTNCLIITGRQKSMIVLKSGKKVFPEEVEHLINQNDFIKESMVWGEENESGVVIISAKFVLDEKALDEKHGLKPEDEEVQKLIDQLIKDVNASMPSFKSIRQHVFSFKDMIKTTTLKIRRQIEIDKLKNMMAGQKLRWRELTGKNIDRYHESDLSGPKDDADSKGSADQNGSEHGSENDEGEK
jgi:long-chain acyl-CoA synthetase